MQAALSFFQHQIKAVKKYLFQVILLIVGLSSSAQLLTVNPIFPVDTSSITIVADCSKGNQGLYNYVNQGDVYVHIGVITNLSTSNGDWKYVKFNNFNVGDPSVKASSLGNNLYQFVVSNIRSFFGVPAGETIKKIAILFRNGAGSSVLRNTDGSDMYIPVYTTALAGKFTSPNYQPKAIPIPEPITKIVGDNLPVTYTTSSPANINLYFNGNLLTGVTNASAASATPVIASAGSQQIIAVASNGTTTVNDTINFYVATPVNIAPLPAGVQDGINYEPGDTSAILVLRAPGKTRATVLGDFNNWTEQANYQMNQTPDAKFFWLRITGLLAGTEYAYQYYVDGSIKIADPYTQKVLDPDNDQYISATTYPNLKSYPTGKTSGIVSVLQTKEPAYNWQVSNFARPNKHSLIVYELLVRDFTATHDYNALKDTIGYLKNLGINTIELMPINEFEGNSSWGYNPNFYFAPDKYYGPKASLKAFIDECHKNGMAVVMDIALNHSFGSSPMVQLYWDAVNNRPAANNPWFNQEPKHAFNVGYDMNHESLDTKYYFDRITQFWLQEYKMDGFRFDLAKGFTQKQTCDNNGNNCDVNAWGNYDSSRVAIWKRYYDSLQTYSTGSYVILEHFAANNEETDLSNYGMMLWGNENYAFNQATMGYPNGWDFSQAISTVRGWPQPSLVAYMESHDEERQEYRNVNFGNAAGSYSIKDLNTGLKRNEMAAAFFFMIPGPKMIWQFGELGYDYSINTCQDGTVNNNCRLDVKPIRWDYLQVASRKHLHDVYASLLQLRVHPLFKAGFVTNRIDEDFSGVFKWLRLTTDTSNIVVVGNFDLTSNTGAVTFQSAGTWYDYLNGTTITATGASQNITLQPGEYHVYVNRNITNTVPTPVFDINNPNNLFVVAVLPNPVQPASQLKISLPGSGHLQIKVLDQLGKQLSEYDAGYKAKGIYQYPLAAICKNGLTQTGIYTVQISIGTQVKSVKILVNN